MNVIKALHRLHIVADVYTNKYPKDTKHNKHKGR